MKICNKCQETKDISEFRNRKLSKDGKHSWCKVCCDVHKKVWYEKNKKKYRKLASIWAKKRKVEIQNFLIEFLQNHPCIDCNETNIVVLDFDHRGNKKYNISNMMSSSLIKVKEEISKCDIRCANCHRIKTSKQFNWHKSRIGEVGTLRIANP